MNGTRIALTVLAFSLFETSSAQTCSCASIPLLGTMQSASPTAKQWYFAGTYEYHEIGDLVAGSSTIPDDIGRDRNSQAFIAELSYGFAPKWSVSALLSAVEHNREVGGTADSASGLGDGLVMLKYSASTISLYSKNTLSFGLGARVPLGSDDARNGDIVLAEDLQPSVGSYGALFWAYYARALNDSRGAQVYVSANHTLNGENDRDYRFGDSTTLSLGANYQTQTPWGFSFEVQYRNAERDRRASVDIPNTGGNWLHAIPAVQYHVTESFALKASVKIPVARDLNDSLQFTTKYAARLSMLYQFGS